MKKKSATAPATEAPPIKSVLVMRTCDANLRSHGGFQWPVSGMVSAPDWSPDPVCGQGLHGLLWGEGDGGLLDWSADAKWLVCRVDESTIVSLGGKVKFPSCEVIFCGDRKTAPEYISANGAAGRAVVSGTATAGDRGTATAGDRGTATAGDSGTATAGNSGTATAGNSGTATAGDRGTATAGYRGTATAGNRGTATAGYRGTATAGYRGTATAGNSGTATAGYRGTATAGNSGTATAGDSGTATAGVSGTATAGDSGTATAGDRGTATAGAGGVISILHWNGKRYKVRIAHVKDEDGDGELEPNVKYRLDESGQFVKVEVSL